MSMKDETTSALKAMLNKNSGFDATTVRAALKELKRRGEPTPPASMVTGGRNIKNPDAPPSRPKKKMAKGGDTKKVPVISIGVGMAEMPKGKKGPMKMAMGGMANGKKHMYLNNGGSVKDLNPGLEALNKVRPDVVKKILKKS